MSYHAVRVGDRVVLRKPHPCGGKSWIVIRAGADVGLECEKCGRRVMLGREDFERRIVAGAEASSEPGSAA